MVELKGSLDGIGLSAIVQLIGELHHSGTLQLAKGTAHGVLGFDDGRLVMATYERDQGLQALATVAHDLADAEFTFIEGPVSHDDTLDLSYAELQQQLGALSNGSAPKEAPLSLPNTSSEELETCPLLGFADDRTRHYSRPTALHRCFAGGAASLVTSQEQRELCLADRFGTCPRYRNSTIEPAPPAPPTPAPPTPAPPTPAPEVPAGVAARMANLNTMRVSYPDGTQPTPSQSPTEPPPRRLRSLPILIGGGVIGLILVVAALVVVVPSFNNGLLPQPTPETAGAFQALPTNTTRPAPAPTVAQQVAAQPKPSVAPTSVPTLFPTAPPTAAPKPTVAANVGRALVDLRLADGPAANWRENPPYAGWSDGAYRIQARQAARFVAVGVPVDSAPGDIVVTATFRKTGGPPGGGYGLIVRDQSPDPLDGVSQTMSAYVLETGDLGEFGVWRRDGDHWFDLVPWTRSGAVRPGGSPNELSVRAVADRLVFSANGVELATVQDDTFPAGGVGMFVGGDYNEVAVDRFSIQVPN